MSYKMPRNLTIAFAFCAFISSLSGAVLADDIVYNRTIKAYSLDALSVETFDDGLVGSSITVSPIVYNPGEKCPDGCLDACVPHPIIEANGDIPEAWEATARNSGLPLAVVFNSRKCDLTVSVANIGKLQEYIDSRGNSSVVIKGAVELFSLLWADESYDGTVRFAFSPHSVRERYGLVAHRVYGADSDFLFRDAMGCSFPGLSPSEAVPTGWSSECSFKNGASPNVVNMTLVPEVSSFQQLYESAAWVVYIAYGLIVYSILFGVAIRSFMVARKNQQRMVYGSRANFQQTATILLTLLFATQLVDFSFATLRIFRVWVSEILVQVVWGLTNILQVLSFTLLVLFWNEVLHKAHIGGSGISRPSQKALALFALFLVAYTVILMPLYVVKVWGEQSTLLLFMNTGMTGLLALGFAMAMLIYGSKIIKRLTLGTPGTFVKKKLAPLTRLVRTCAVMTLVTTILVAVTFVTDVLNEPSGLYIGLFALLTFMASTTFGLVLHTISPLRASTGGSSANTSQAQLNRTNNTTGQDEFTNKSELTPWKSEHFTHEL